MTVLEGFSIRLPKITLRQAVKLSYYSDGMNPIFGPSSKKAEYLDDESYRPDRWSQRVISTLENEFETELILPF